MWCSKKVEQEPTGVGLEEFPNWVIDPKVEGGIAASECIPWSGNLSIDKAQDKAQARATLAKQLEVRVSALDKTYIERTDAAGKTVTGSSFSSVLLGSIVTIPQRFLTPSIGILDILDKRDPLKC